MFNIGNSQPTPLLRFIEVMEQALGREAIRNYQPMQPGDVVATAADTQALEDQSDSSRPPPLRVALNGLLSGIDFLCELTISHCAEITHLPLTNKPGVWASTQH